MLLICVDNYTCTAVSFDEDWDIHGERQDKDGDYNSVEDDGNDLICFSVDVITEEEVNRTESDSKNPHHQ